MPHHSPLPPCPGFRLVYLPFLLATTGFIAGYSLLHWLLFIRFDVGVVSEVAVNVWLPLVLAVFVVFLVMRQRIALLRVKNEELQLAFLILCWITMALPTTVAQMYLQTATGRMVCAGQVNDIHYGQGFRYYHVWRWYACKSRRQTRLDVSITGMQNQHFNLNYYITVPLYNSATDTATQQSSCWLAIPYQKTVSSKLSPAQKTTILRKFIAASAADFDTTDLSSVSYFTMVGRTHLRAMAQEAIASSPWAVAKSPVIVEANTTPFSQRNGYSVQSFLCCLLAGLLGFGLVVLTHKPDSAAIGRWQTGPPSPWAGLTDYMRLFVPCRHYFVTPIIMDINIMVFLAMVFCGEGFISFPAAPLIAWGANYGPLTRAGEWWRLLTALFLHSGLIHVAANMYGLLYAGIYLEPVVGRVRLMGLYLFSGLCASLCSLWWYRATVSVGASGAIFGLYGFFLATLLLRVFPPGFTRALSISIIIFIGFNLLAGIGGGVDNAAHVGGLVAGFAAGVLRAPRLRKLLAARAVPEQV